jgi:hypothetical protein
VDELFFPEVPVALEDFDAEPVEPAEAVVEADDLPLEPVDVELRPLEPPEADAEAATDAVADADEPEALAELTDAMDEADPLEPLLADAAWLPVPLEPAEATELSVALDEDAVVVLKEELAFDELEEDPAVTDPWLAEAVEPLVPLGPVVDLEQPMVAASTTPTHADVRTSRRPCILSPWQKPRRR